MLWESNETYSVGNTAAYGNDQAILTRLRSQEISVADEAQAQNLLTHAH